MLKELRKALFAQTGAASITRAGTIVAVGDNQLYAVRVDAAVYENVSSAGGLFHRAGESVMVVFYNNKPIIVS